MADFYSILDCFRRHSREDLEEMLRSPAYFDAFFGTLPQTLAMFKEHEELLKANEELTGELTAMVHWFYYPDTNRPSLHDTDICVPYIRQQRRTWL